MRRVQDKVALVTGAARGQGRSHALKLAEEGADIIAIDLCGPVESTPYALSTRDDLDETIALVEKTGRKIEAHVADVRDAVALRAAVSESVERLGRLDIVAANAGIISYGTVDSLSGEMWNEVIDINLTGVWNTVQASVPHIRSGGQGGSIHVTSSALGLRVAPALAHYAAAKHGLSGLVKTLAVELGPENIRVNAIHPGQCDTDLIHNEATYRLFCPDVESPGKADFIEVSIPFAAMNIPYIEPIDVSNALLFLASDDARYITGVALPIDGGTVIK